MSVPSPAPKSTNNPFQDVKSKQYYYNAVLWASENGITGGIDQTHFGPKNNCTRAELMVFLKAAFPFLAGEPLESAEPIDSVNLTLPAAPAVPAAPVAPVEPVNPVDLIESTDIVASADFGTISDYIQLAEVDE